MVTPERRSPLDDASWMPLVYDELRALAGRYLRRERPNHTLQPTALVHEAWLKLARLDRIQIRDRTHFLALAASAMRQILVDHARAHRALKRGGDWMRVTLDDSLVPDGAASDELIALDRALLRLGEHDERAMRIVEMRFFAGLTEAEIAESIGMSARWVRQQWAFARAWLKREMTRAPEMG